MSVASKRYTGPKHTERALEESKTTSARRIRLQQVVTRRSLSPRKRGR